MFYTYVCIATAPFATRKANHKRGRNRRWSSKVTASRNIFDDDGFALKIKLLYYISLTHYKSSFASSSGDRLTHYAFVQFRNHFLLISFCPFRTGLFSLYSTMVPLAPTVLCLTVILLLPLLSRPLHFYIVDRVHY